MNLKDFDFQGVLSTTLGSLALLSLLLWILNSFSWITFLSNKWYFALTFGFATGWLISFLSMYKKNSFIFNFDWVSIVVLIFFVGSIINSYFSHSIYAFFTIKYLYYYYLFSILTFILFLYFYVDWRFIESKEKSLLLLTHKKYINSKNKSFKLLTYILFSLEFFLIFITSNVKLLFLFTYRKSVQNKEKVILLLVYVLFIFELIFVPKLYSIEWAFVLFIVVAILFYLFKIDSRFLILPALLLLWYCPFLLMYKQSVLAEKVAVFVYYFLVVGVILQIFEKNLNLEIDYLKKIIFDKWVLIVGIVFVLLSLVLIFLFKYINPLITASCLYLGTTLLILFLSKYVID